MDTLMKSYMDTISSYNLNNAKISAIYYPESDEFEYLTRLRDRNIDVDRVKDIKRNKAFVVGKTEGIKKDIKSDVSIFSSKFGNQLKDLNPYIDRYKCQCGNLKSKVNEDVLCPLCNTRCKFVDDDFEFGAYLVLNDYYVIHPNLFKKIESFIGEKNLDDIINIKEKKDVNGRVIKREFTKDHPFNGIGMIEFRNRFDEIMQFYLNKKKNKIDKYLDIMENRDRIFTQSMWVYTTHLRPIDPNTTQLAYESTNEYYYIMSTLVTKINDTSIDIRRNLKNKNDLLYDLQVKWMALYDSILAILSTKKGNFRTVFGGRCNFSGRNVIRQNIALDIDQITLSYYSLVELLQQRIINILQKIYNITYSQAYNIWWYSNIVIDQRVVNIINSLITGSYMGLGLPVLINRNPTIAYGSILQVFVVGMTFDHTMCVPLRTLKLYEGDFDGDVENIFLIINKDFMEAAFKIYNPKNAMMISRNDGKFNKDTENQRDTIINANSLMQLCRDRYTAEELALINNIPDRIV